jgi:hypothetical protein
MFALSVMRRHRRQARQARQAQGRQGSKKPRASKAQTSLRDGDSSMSVAASLDGSLTEGSLFTVSVGPLRILFLTLTALQQILWNHNQDDIIGAAVIRMLAVAHAKLHFA